MRVEVSLVSGPIFKENVSLSSDLFLTFLRFQNVSSPRMVRARHEFRPAHGLCLRLPMPFLDFDQGPKPPVERGDALAGSGDVYVDDGLWRDLGGGLPGGESPGDRLLDHRFDVGVVESIHGSVLQPNDGTGDN